MNDARGELSCEPLLSLLDTFAVAKTSRGQDGEGPRLSDRAAFPITFTLLIRL